MVVHRSNHPLAIVRSSSASLEPGDPRLRPLGLCRRRFPNISKNSATCCLLLLPLDLNPPTDSCAQSRVNAIWSSNAHLRQAMAESIEPQLARHLAPSMISALVAPLTLAARSRNVGPSPAAATMKRPEAFRDAVTRRSINFLQTRIAKSLLGLQQSKKDRGRCGGGNVTSMVVHCHRQGWNPQEALLCLAFPKGAGPTIFQQRNRNQWNTPARCLQSWLVATWSGPAA